MLYAFDGKIPKISKTAYISDQALVIGEVDIGNHCYIGHGVILRGDYGRIEIGSGTAVEENVTVHAPPGDVCKIGRKVTLGHGAIVHAGKIGDRSVIGMGAILSLRSRIGERAIVAEGAVVKRNQQVPARAVVAGNPAKWVRQVTPEDEKRWGKAKQLYIDLAKKYLNIGLQPVDRMNSIFGKPRTKKPLKKISS